MLLDGEGAFGGDQGGLGGSGLRLRLLLVQRRQGADLDARGVFDDQLLGQLDGLLLNDDVFPVVDQVVIRSLHRRDRLHDLQLEGQVGIFHAVLGDADVHARRIKPEVLQQGLGEGDAGLAAGLVKREPRGAAVSFRDISRKTIVQAPGH